MTQAKDSPSRARSRTVAAMVTHSNVVRPRTHVERVYQTTLPKPR